MKKVVFFSFLIAVSIWTIVFVTRQKEELKKEEEKPTVVESQTSSKVSSPIGDMPSSQSSQADYRLRILTEPPNAKIFINDENVGQSPFEVPVPAESKKLRLSLEGYDDYERQIPAAKDSEGDLVWKIQLKKVQKESHVKFYPKDIAPFSIQLKAVPLSDFSDSDAESFKDVNAKFCRVQIKDKVWVRVVVGPFVNKQKAQLALKNVKAKHADAFVSKNHKCIGKE